MPATIQHVFNSPIADGTNTQIVRPSDWNSAHALTLNLSGTDMIGGFTNSGNISFSTNTAGYIYADGPGAGTGGGITRVAGGTTFGTGPIISFADGNNITFGMNGNTITASASYVTQTVDTNKAGIGETVGTIAGTDLAMTVNTDGVSIGYPKWLTTAQPVGAYLTTAMQSNAATISNIRVSGGTTSNLLSAITFADGNGVSFGLDAGTVTATVATNYQSQGAYLTTAMASNRGSDFMGTNTALTANGVSMTANSSGLSLNFPAFLTTAALSDHSHGNPTLALTNLSGTTASNSAGLTLSLSANAAAAGVGIEAGTRTATTAGNLRFETGNGITFGLNGVGGSVMTASHNAITTGRASNDAIGLNTALTANGVSMTANSSGLSLNFPAFLTTAAQSSASNVSGVIAGTNATGGTATLSGNVSFSNANGISFYTSAGNAVVGTVRTDYQSAGAYLTTAALSNHSHGNPTLNLTNINGTTASNSAGLTLSLSAIVPAQSVQPVAASASNGSYNFSTLKFVEGSGVTWATQANGIQASVKTDYLTTAMLSNAATISNIRVSGGTTSNLLSAITFADSNGVSFGLNAGTLTATVKTDYQTAGAYLTTAMASNRGSDFVQANAVFNGTNASGTIASNGISVSVAGPQAGVGIAAGTRTATTAGNLLFDTGNGITFGLDVVGGSIMTASHNGLTTAMASNRGSDFMGTATALTAGPLAWTANSAGLSLNASSVAGTTTGFAGTNISGSMTHNTAGLSLNLSVAAPGAGGGIALSAGSDSNFTNGTVTFGNAFSGSFVTSNGSVVYSNAFLTTAAQNNHSHGNPTLALTNLSGTTASNSAGLTLSLSAAAGGAGDGYNIVSLGTTGTTGTAWSTASGTVAINGSGGVVVSQNNSNQLVISGPATSSIANTGQLSMSVNGATISLGVPEAMNTQRLQWPPGQLTAVAALGNGSFSIHRMEACNPISASRLDVPLLVNIGSTAAANTWGLAVTAFAAVYTKNSNTLSSLSSGSVTWSTSKASNNAGGTQINGVGIRPMSVPININMTPGEYYVGFGISTNTSSAGTATTTLGNTWSIMGGMIYSSAVPHVGDFTAVTNTSTGLYGGHGVYSAAISTVPPTVSLSAINQTGSYYARGAVGLIFRNQ